MTDNKEKIEFISTYKLDYAKYKEFSKGFMASKKSTIILSFLLILLFIIYLIYEMYSAIIWIAIIFLLLMIITRITGSYKMSYKRSKSLNDNEDIETTVKINNEKIIMTSKKGNVANYSFDQIVNIIETKNLLILKFKYNMGIIIDKNNIEGGTKEELIEYLFSVSKNIKKKKVYKTNIGLITRKIAIIVFAIVTVLAIIFSYIKSNRIDKFQRLLEQNNYNVERDETVNDGYDKKTLTISKENEHTWMYIYDFKTEAEAKSTIKYWADMETNKNSNKFLEENKGNYQKYIIDEDQYIILIRNDNLVFYGFGHSDYKEELNNALNIINYMK